MKSEEHIQFWLESAAHDLDAAESLFTTGKYDWCPFLGHLVLEKTLKAILVQKQSEKIPPKTHNLVKLAEKSSLELTDDQKIFLDEVNDFNLEIRYPDYKKAFYLYCTREYTTEYFNKEVIAKRFVMPECFYRASRISGICKLDSRPETSRE